MKIVANLLYSGNCREAFESYAQIFNGKVRAMITFGEAPWEEKLGPDYKDLIMHAWLDIGDQALMGCDAPPTMEGSHHTGFTASVHTADLADARRMFDALAGGGATPMPFAETPWSPGFGMLIDRFGIPWSINVEQRPSATSD